MHICATEDYDLEAPQHAKTPTPCSSRSGTLITLSASDESPRCWATSKASCPGPPRAAERSATFWSFLTSSNPEGNHEKRRAISIHDPPSSHRTAL